MVSSLRISDSPTDSAGEYYSRARRGSGVCADSRKRHPLCRLDRPRAAGAARPGRRTLNDPGYHAVSGTRTPCIAYEERCAAGGAGLDGGRKSASKSNPWRNFSRRISWCATILGRPMADLRTCMLYAQRRMCDDGGRAAGTRDFDADPKPKKMRYPAADAPGKFRTRPRDCEGDENGVETTNQLIDEAIRDLGRDLTCDLWFAAEREFWMRRTMPRAQKARQDRLGLGWANHDHHTYRSSRRNFTKLIATWEKLGFQCRERFYAGREAGWGAQVIEQPAPASSPS